MGWWGLVANVRAGPAGGSHAAPVKPDQEKYQRHRMDAGSSGRIEPGDGRNRISGIENTVARHQHIGTVAHQFGRIAAKAAATEDDPARGGKAR